MPFDLATATPVDAGATPQNPSNSGFDVSTARAVEAPNEVVFHEEAGKNVAVPAGTSGPEADFLVKTQVQNADRSRFMGIIDMGADWYAGIGHMEAEAARGLGAFAVSTLPKMIGGNLQEAGERDPTKSTDPLQRIAAQVATSVNPEGMKAASAELAAAGKRLSAKADEWVTQLNLDRPKEGGAAGVAYDLGGGSGSVFASLGLLALRQPQAAAAFFGNLEKSQIYQEARAKGIDPETAGQASTIAGVVQGGLEAAGNRVFESMAKVYSPVKRIIARAIEEGTQEGAQQAGEEAVTTVAGIRDDDYKQKLDRVGYAAALGAAVGAPAAAIYNLVDAAAEQHDVEPAVARRVADNVIAQQEPLQRATAGMMDAASTRLAHDPKAEGEAAEIIRQNLITRSPADATSQKQQDSAENSSIEGQPATTVPQAQLDKLDRDIDEAAALHEASPTASTQSRLDALLSERDQLEPEPQFRRADELPMDDESRLVRAREQGFDVDTPLFHGTPREFDEFNPSRDGAYGAGVYTAKQRGDAEAYGHNVLELFARGKMFDARYSAPIEPKEATRLLELAGVDMDKFKQFEQDLGHPLDGGTVFNYIRNKVGSAKVNDLLKKAGYDGVNTNLGNRVVFDPKNLRRTDAAFNPAEQDSANLKLRRAEQVEKPEFKNWFGDSKVVDDEGKPLVVYHGTDAMFNAFDPAKGGSNGSAEGYGFYFTDDKSTAEGYSKINGGGRVVDAYISMKKPLDVNAPKFNIADLQKVIKKAVELEIKQFPDEQPDYKDTFLSNFVDTHSNSLEKSVAETARILFDGNENAIDQIAELSNVSGSRLNIATAVRDTLGYDGITAKGYGGRGEGGGNIYVAWFPEQIKSASGNSGAFDRNNPDINMQRGGEGAVPADASRRGRGLVGTDVGDLKPGEQQVVDMFNKQIQRLAPMATPVASRRLYATEETGMAGEVEGAAAVQYRGDQVRQLLHWSLEGNDVMGTGRHEAVHILRNAGLFTDAEWAALTRDVTDKGLVDKVSKAYAPEQRVEEAVAERYRTWKPGEGGIVDRVMQRIKTVLNRIAEEARSLFGKDVTAEDVMARIERGEVGKREAPAQNRMTEALALRRSKVDEAVAGGRLRLLDGKIRDHDGKIDEVNKEINARQAKGQPTKSLENKLAKLDDERNQMDLERGEILTHSEISDAQSPRTAEDIAAQRGAQDVLVKGRTLTNMDKMAAAEKAQALITGIRRGRVLAKEDAKTAQEQVIDMLEQSGLPREDRAKFIRSIKNIQDPKQLDKAMALLQSRVSALTQRNARNAARNAMLKVLKSTKVQKQSGKPKGKYTPEIQDILDRLRAAGRLSAEAAQDKLDARLANEGPVRPIDALENRVLAMVADLSSVTPEEATTTLQGVRELVDEGKSAALERQLARAENLSNLRHMARKAVVAGEDRTLVDRTTLGERLKAVGRKLRATEYAALKSWTDSLNLIFGKDKTGAGQELIEKLGYGVSDAFQNRKGIARRAQEKFMDGALEAFGFTKPRQLLNQLDRDSVKQDLGIFTNKAGKQVRLQMSKAEARKRWMELQDPTMYESITSERGNAYTPEMVDAVTDWLTPQDKAFAQKQLDFYRWFYPQINDVYSRNFGVNLPNNPFYSPVSRRHNNEAEADLFQGEQAYRRSVAPGGLKSRVANLNPLRDQSDFGVLQKHIAEMSHFMAFQDKIQELNSVFSDNTLRDEIKDRFSAAMNKHIAEYMQDFTRGQLKRITDGTEALEKLRQNFSVAVLGAKPALYAKQIVAFMAYTEKIPPHEMVKGMADFVRHPAEAARILNSSELLKARGTDLDRDIALAQKNEGIGFSRKLTDFRNIQLLPAQWGDRSSVLLGGWAVYKYNRDVLGKSHEDSIKAFERATAETQQSADLDQLSRLQATASTFTRLATMFMSGQNQFYRREARAILDYSRGNIGAGEFAKKVALYHFILPSLFQLVADFGIDKGNQARAAIFGSLNGVFILYDIADAIVRKLMDDKVFERGGNDALDFAHKIFDGTTKLVEAEGDPEEVFKGLKKLATGLGQLGGLPLGRAFDVAEGTGNIRDGDTEAGMLRILGWPGSVADTKMQDAADDE